MTHEERDKADEVWSSRVAASIVDELLVAKLVTEDQADWTRKIVAQDIWIKLISGFRPPDSNCTTTRDPDSLTQ
jgi:hypothetical protein